MKKTIEQKFAEEGFIEVDLKINPFHENVKEEHILKEYRDYVSRRVVIQFIEGYNNVLVNFKFDGEDISVGYSKEKISRLNKAICEQIDILKKHFSRASLRPKYACESRKTI